MRTKKMRFQRTNPLNTLNKFILDNPHFFIKKKKKHARKQTFEKGDANYRYFAQGLGRGSES